MYVSTQKTLTLETKLKVLNERETRATGISESLTAYI